VGVIARMTPSGYLFCLLSIAAGIVNLIWGDFETAHQPIQAFGDHVPGRAIYADITALGLVGGGAAAVWSRTRAAGSIVLALVYAIFAILWLPRLYTAPHILGQHAGVYIGVLGGVGIQLILAAAATILYAVFSPRGDSLRPSLARIAFWVFGLCTIDFGLAHLTGISANAGLVPKWLPPSQAFWVVLTGIAFVLAGVGMLSGILDVLAARLLALMLFVFSLLILVPNLFEFPYSHAAWGTNVFNLTAVSAALIVADYLAGRRRERAPP
jgi:hypothetical protein